MPEYTALALVSVAATVLLARALRVRLFRTAQYWLALGIVFAFQVLVDGWLTKLSAPIVVYNPEHHLGVRWPWDIPVEDFLFGFSLVTSSLILWERQKERNMTPARPVARGEVPEAFDEVADRYDLMVALNPGYHAHLRSSAEALVASLPRVHGPDAPAPARVVDLGCGSGASTRALLDAFSAAGRPVEVVGVDGSAGMLRSARAKSWPPGVSFVQARAEQLVDRPDLTGPGGLDAVFAAYLVRNVPDRDALLRSLRAVLAPGGVVVVHDYSVAGRAVPTAIWTAVCWGVVVPLGWLTSRRTRLYRYLWRSVLDFDSTARLMDRLQTAGFEDVRTRTVRGWQRGIVHTVSGRRPAAAR